MLLKKVLCPLAAVLCLAAGAPSAALAGDAAPAKESVQANEDLAAILAAQPAEVKDRYAARHPAETLGFFEVRKGDVVVETLPSGGWYSRILYPYLGESGKLIGANYPLAVYQRFGWDKERLQSVLEKNVNWPKLVTTDPVAKGGEVVSAAMTELPDQLNGTVDKVLFIRSLHNLSRFNKDGGYLDNAIKEAFRVLKPGGIAGVVQHRAQESAPDAWADGSNGYLKQTKVVAAFEAAGFKFVEAKEINANPKDRPKESENVWRLPPALRGLEKDSDAWRANKEIGESDRMTLKFVKPAK